MALTCLLAGEIVAFVLRDDNISKEGPRKWFRSMLAKYAVILVNEVHFH